MSEQAKRKSSKIFDGVLISCVFVLLAFSILISGGGRAIADTLAQRKAAASFVEGGSESDCPPCEEKARQVRIETARIQTQGISDVQGDE